MVGLDSRIEDADALLYERLVRIGHERYHLPILGARSAAIRTLAVYRDLLRSNPGLSHPARMLAATHRNACLRSIAWCVSNRPDFSGPGDTKDESEFSPQPGEAPSERVKRIRQAIRSPKPATHVPELCRIATWDPDRGVRRAAHTAVRRIAAEVLGPDTPPGPRLAPDWQDLKLLQEYLSGAPIEELAAEHRETTASLRARLGFSLECLRHAGFGEDDWLNKVLIATVETDRGPLAPWNPAPGMDAHVGFLVDTLDDPEPEARRDAARQLGECGRRAEDALTDLRRLADEDPDRLVRRAARCAVVRVLGARR